MDEDFSAWAAEAERPLIRSAYLLTGDLHRSEDLVQEAMVKVALRWGRLRDGQPTAYARRIIARDHVSLWRRRGREVPVAEPAADAEVSSDPETVLVVRRALGRLTPAQRAVVVLRHFDDLTERETADALGISIGTVKSQNAVALARLRTGAPELLDLVEPAGLGEAAAAEARRRRTQRRVVAGTVVAVLALVAAGVLVVADGPHREPPPVSPTPASPTSSPSAGPTGAANPEGLRLDPQLVDDLPDAPEGLVPELPRVVDPPEDAPDVADSPVEAALMVVEKRGVLHLMTPSGDWRQLRPPTPGTWFFALSPRGTGLVAWEYAATTATAYDLGAGTLRTVAQPAGADGYEVIRWAWRDEERLILTSYAGSWEVDATDSSATPLDHPGENAAWVVDPEGAVVESADRSRPALMTDWSGGAAREVSLDRAGRIERFDVNGDRVAASSLGVPWQGQEVFGLVVADRASMTPTALVEVIGPVIYRDGPFGVIALRDDGTVLVHVGVVGRSPRTRILAWRPGHGDIVVETRIADGLGAYAFAQQLLRQGAP